MQLRFVLLMCIAVLLGLSFGVASCGKPKEPAHAAAQKQYYQCPMHPQIIRDAPGKCPICGMDLMPVKSDQHEGAAAGEAGVVKIDPTTVQNMGVTEEKVAMRSLVKEIRVSSTIDLNETAQSIINTKIGGWVEKLYVDYTGQQVRRGQPLLTLYSPDLVSTQEEYLQAIRFRESLGQGASADAIKGADELVASGRRRLLNWDIGAREIEQLEKRGTPEKTMTIYAPANGVVLEKMVVAGQNVTPGAALYKVADLSTVWAMANVYQEDLPYVKIGQEAAVELPSMAGKQFSGRVQFVSPVLDMATKTAAVRVAIRNTADFALKPQMFATAVIQSPAALSAIAVSRQAVLHTGKRDVVIIALGNGRFKAQQVTLGMSAGGYVQILSGLSEGQTVVTSSQFLIDSESNLKEALDRMDTRDEAQDSVPAR